MPTPPSERHLPQRILIVDAADDERAMYALALRQAGYDVRESSDGEDGFAESLLFAPDVVVANVSLPRLSGIQLVGRMREDDDTRDVPVIVLTGYDQPVETIVRAKAAGATAVRIKPCLPHTLLQDIRRVLEESARLRLRSGRSKS